MFGIVPRRKREEKLWAYEPPMEWLRREFSPIFDRMFGRWPFFAEPEGLLPYGAEMEDTDEALIVREVVPGFEATEIEVKVSGNLLTVRAERKEKKGETEKLVGEFSRSVYLPEGVDRERVEATYRNGVLEVKLPKLPEAKERHIEVKTI